jgi:hypothetical protein
LSEISVKEELKSWNKYGLTAKHKGGKFYSYRNGKLTGEFNTQEELAKHQHDLIKDE